MVPGKVFKGARTTENTAIRVQWGRTVAVLCFVLVDKIMNYPYVPMYVDPKKFVNRAGLIDGNFAEMLDQGVLEGDMCN